MTLRQYSRVPESASPYNGSEILGDVWLAVDTTGTPSRFFGRYTLADGTVIQIIDQDRTREVVRFASPLPSGPDSDTCERVGPSSVALLLRNLPMQRSDAELLSDGYTRIAADTWSRNETHGDVSTTRTLTISGPTAMILSEHSIGRAPDGAVITEFRLTTDSFEVINALPPGLTLDALPADCS